SRVDLRRQCARRQITAVRNPPGSVRDITPVPGSRFSAGLAWSEERNGSYLQTPVVYGELIYASTSQGIFKAYDARTGRKLYVSSATAGPSPLPPSPRVAKATWLIKRERQSPSKTDPNLN